MKNLANCTPVEFLKQTNKIRHEVESWLKDTKIMDIRKNRPVLIPLTPSMTEEEMEEAKKENRERTRKQTYLNISNCYIFQHSLIQLQINLEQLILFFCKQQNNHSKYCGTLSKLLQILEI